VRLPDDFLQKIACALQDEELDVYTLLLYSIDSKDMEYFPPKDREQVRRIFKILMDDTQRHADLLRLIVEMGEG
jgi:hypothetical protein